ncbi:PRC-barrel domain-containing protein [Caballeronia ptereochthonis]|uniref:PRC-barrel domain-containing protein n=1 Tax=Caballeronia ptereochthonis TaxID=1777144 RepID=A0A158EA84_9BURK|nr:PRC-barrel domain-containing protein [Caballeronia ptereochthonis]SAL03801.1 PRC-barrel domain-containing protein [Caballeronia ptereochthonis]
MTGGFLHRGDAPSNGLRASDRACRADCAFHAAARWFLHSMVRLFVRLIVQLPALAAACAQTLRAMRFTASLPVFAAFALSACGLMPQQTPAPIVEHSYIPTPAEAGPAEPEEPLPAVQAPEPASAVKPAPAPKPKRRIVRPKPPEPAVTPPPEPPEPPPPPQIISTRIMQHEQLHGLLDSEVQRPDGKVVGRAVDMYVDASAKPRLLMVNLAGFLGVGDRKVNFPWTAFRFTPNAKGAPITFVQPPPVKGKPADPVPKPQPVNEAPPNLVQLVDSTVMQKNGARIGRVVDVLVDSQAQPEALVLDLSSSLAGDKRHVAANWGDLHVISRNKQWQLQMDFNDAQLKASPTYAPEQPIKIVSPVAPAPASTASAASAAPASSGTAGTTASGAVAAQTPASGARPAR